MTADKIRVLLIDDHPVVRSGIRMLLERAPDLYVVGEADRGDRALELVTELTPDVLLLDMEMPGKSGLDVARELAEAKAPVRILALSAYDDEQYIVNLLASGAAGYLTKEEALDTIVDAVRGVAQGEDGWLSRRAAARIAQVTRQQIRDPIELTRREEQVLDKLAEGLSNNQIAGALHITERTVRFHLTNIYEKIDVSTRSEAINWALTKRQDR